LAQIGESVATVAPPETLAVKRGSTVSQSLRVTLRPGFHVNSDKPKDEFLIPLKLTWTGPLEVQKVVYPKPEEVKVGTDMLNVFTGSFDIQTRFTAPAQATAGVTMMQGKLHYQACDNQSCKRPATLSVQLPVSIQ
jgi:hypothetical protein